MTVTSAGTHGGRNVVHPDTVAAAAEVGVEPAQVGTEAAHSGMTPLVGTPAIALRVSTTRGDSSTTRL